MPELDASHWLILCAAVFAVAFFYSSVGHGGATGHLAALALLGMAPVSARVAVLIANVLVAGIAWWQFWRVPLSFVVIFSRVLAGILFFSGGKLLIKAAAR